MIKINKSTSRMRSTLNVINTNIRRFVSDPIAVNDEAFVASGDRFLLLETGDFILMENSDKLLLEIH
jgi:hypothetical protein